MGGISLTSGFRFHPTDEELVGYYLKRKTDELEIELEVIPVIDLYKFDPWELPATKSGYWKATGKDRKVVCKPAVVGYRKTLTDWVMHEYRLCDDVSQGIPGFQGPFALCRVIKRKDISSRTGNVHGGTAFKQVECSSSNETFTSTVASKEPRVLSDNMPTQTTYMSSESNRSTPINSSYQTTRIGNFDSATGNDVANIWMPQLDPSKECPQGRCMSGNNSHVFSISTSWQPSDQYEFISSSSFPNFGEEVELSGDLNGYGCVSPFSFHGSYMEFYGNEDIAYKGYNQNDLLGNPNLF
ncbi:unnamed protein product [Withania somnifera]